MFYLSDKETRNNMHSFKCITVHYLKEYRIMDLTDTTFIGKVELYKSNDKKILNFAKGKYWETREDDTDTVKINGYWIFVSPDYDSMGAIEDMDKTRWVLKQMADFFLKTEVRRYPFRYLEFVARKSELTDVRTVMKRSKRPNKPEEEAWLPRTIKLMSTPDREIERKEFLKKKYFWWIVVAILGLAILVGVVYLLIYHWEEIVACIVFGVLLLLVIGGKK